MHIVKKVVGNLHLLRVDDPDTRFFEGLWEIPEGITYNAYVLTTDEGSVVFDTWKGRYADEFVEAVKEVTPLSKVKYVVLHHGEPDHTGALPTFLRAVRNAGSDPLVLGHPMIKGMVESMYGIKLRFKPVKDGEALTVGGTELRFIHTPWLHWPETIMTYIPEYEALITCDAFGAYSIPPKVFDDEFDDLRWYEKHVMRYAVNVIGRFRQHVVKALEKLRSTGIKVSVVAPSHGIVWRRDPSLIIDLYEKFGKGTVTKGKVVVIYSSMYGFVENLIDHVVKELELRGLTVTTFRFTEYEHSRLSELLGELADAAALVVGVSTYEGGVIPSIEHVVNLIVKKAAYRGRPALVVGAYGWAPTAGRLVKDALTKAGYEVIGPIEVKGALTDEVKSALNAAVREIAERASK